MAHISREEFYRRLPDFNPHPTTAAPGTDVFRQVYEQLAQEGADEVMIANTIHIKASQGTGVAAAEEAAAAAAEAMGELPEEAAEDEVEAEEAPAEPAADADADKE